ncbi:MAG: phage tail tape measure protein [Clostridiales bacterium]|jgi:TP901 family phage tail tape measure protein|nr:phage tail tape measure protein [Clostridiales bacterium]
MPEQSSNKYSMLFELGAKIENSFNQSFNQAQTKLDSIEKELGDVEQSANKAESAFGDILPNITMLAGAFIGLDAIKDFFGGSFEKAKNFESAMADVAKVVDGLKTPAGETTSAYAEMSDEILNMSARIPMAADEITKLIAAAGQSGIAAEELTRFAEDAAKMGVAFDLSAEQAGETAAIIRSSLRMSQEEFVVLADKVNYFGNTTTQSADKLIQVVQDTGLIGRSAGVAADQIAAMAAALNGMDAANMGTALSNIYGSLMQGEGATKKAQKAWEKLGFTASQVSKDMLNDAEGTMLKVFKAMKDNINPEELSATVGAIFGNNKSTQQAIAAFTENIDVLKNNFDALGDSTLYAGSMQAEFDSRASATENSIQLMNNAFDALQISIGSIALPYAAEGAEFLTERLKDLSGRIPALAQKFETLAGAVLNVFKFLVSNSSAIINLVKVVGAGFAGWNVATKILPNVKKGLDGILSVSGAVSSAFATNPFGVWLAGIGVLTGLVITLHQKFKESKAAAEEYMLNTGDRIQRAADSLGELVDRQQNINQLKERFDSLNQQIESGVLSTEDLTRAENELKSVKESLISLSGGMISSLELESGAADDAFQKIDELLGKERELAMSELSMKLSETSADELTRVRDSLISVNDSLADHIIERQREKVALYLLNADYEKYRGQLKSSAITQDEYNQKIADLAGKSGIAAHNLPSLQKEIKRTEKELEGLNGQYSENKDKLSAANENLETYIVNQDRYEQLTGETTDRIAEQTDALDENADAIENQGEAAQYAAEMSDEAFKKMQKDIENYLKAVEGLTANITKAYDELSKDLPKGAKPELDSMIKYYEDHAAAMEKWANNITELASRQFADGSGLAEGLMQQLKDAGPASADLVQQLVDASDNKLKELSAVFEKDVDAAMQAENAILTDNADVFPSYIEDMIVLTEEKQPDMENAGAQLMLALVSGIESSEYMLDKAVQNVQSKLTAMASISVPNVSASVSANISSGASAPKTSGAPAKRAVKTTPMAEGGVATGPTFALIGEGRENEAVLPLSKLDDMLQAFRDSMPFSDKSPEIPSLAAGGIATSPTLAIIGEGREDEAVMPLSELNNFLNTFSAPASSNFYAGPNVSSDNLFEQNRILNESYTTPNPTGGSRGSATEPVSRLDKLLNSLSQPAQTNTQIGAPNITVYVTVQGNADAETVKKGVNQGVQEALSQSGWNRMASQYAQNRRRTAFSQ